MAVGNFDLKIPTENISSVNPLVFSEFLVVRNPTLFYWNEGKETGNNCKYYELSFGCCTRPTHSPCLEKELAKIDTWLPQSTDNWAWGPCVVLFCRWKRIDDWKEKPINILIYIHIHIRIRTCTCTCNVWRHLFQIQQRKIPHIVDFVNRRITISTRTQ
jgi:hypothetical protein